MTPSTPSSVSELMSEVKARQTGHPPDWNIFQMDDDMSRLLEICAVYEAALRRCHDTFGESGFVRVTTYEALQAADAIAAGEGATE